MRVRPHGVEDQFAGELGQRRAGGAFEGDPEEDVAEVAVLEPRAGSCGEAERADGPHDIAGALGAGVDRSPTRDPGGVGEQAPQRDTLGSKLLQLREQRRDLLVEREAPAVDERQGNAGADERLGQRGEVEDRVRRHRPRMRHDARRPERLVQEHLAAMADEGHRPRHDAVVDRGLDGGADVVHAGQLEASVTSRSETSEPVG